MVMQPFRGTWPSRQAVAHAERALNEAEHAHVAAPATYPAMNVWMNDDNIIATAELPGCNPDNIDITIEGDTLTVKGRRTDEPLPEGAVYHRRERACGSFSRAFTLPFEIESAEVVAGFENGVLRITLPRAEADKPRKITVRRQ